MCEEHEFSSKGFHPHYPLVLMREFKDDGICTKCGAKIWELFKINFDEIL